MHKGDVWRLDYVARVEGEGGLDLVISGANVEEARLRIFRNQNSNAAVFREVAIAYAQRRRLAT